MTDSSGFEVTKVAVYTPVSEEQVQDGRALAAWWAAWDAMTPEERAAAQREAADARRRERERARRVELTLKHLLLRLDWPEAYARHFVQPYCECGPSVDDAWYFCRHAEEDEGLRP